MNSYFGDYHSLYTQPHPSRLPNIAILDSFSIYENISNFHLPDFVLKLEATKFVLSSSEYKLYLEWGGGKTVHPTDDIVPWCGVGQNIMFTLDIFICTGEKMESNNI